MALNISPLRLALLALFLGLPLAAAASPDADRGWDELDSGNLARARWHFEQALSVDPCEASALKGLAKAGGEVAKYQAECGGVPVPVETAVPAAAPAAVPDAPAPAVAAPSAPAVPVSAAPAAGGAVPAAPASAGPAPVEGKACPLHCARCRVHCIFWSVLALLVLAVAIYKFRKPKSGGTKASAVPEAPEVKVPASIVKMAARQDAVEAAERAAHPAAPAPAPAAPVVPAPAPVSAAAPSASAPLPKPVPASAPGVRLASGQILGTKPFSPGEQVRQALSAGGQELLLTDRKVYWSGERTLLGIFGRKPSPLTVAVPMDQVTGLAWAKTPSGELLVIGTAMAGDIGLRTSLWGKAELQAFAQALSEALDSRKA
jgi:hypothetical protein